MSIQPLRLGILMGSTRPGRFNDRPACWIHDLACKRHDFAVEMLDLRDYPMPFFAEPMAPAWSPVQDAVAQAWGGRIDGLDGLIVVTPEYNHGPPAVLKNALDYAYTEFMRKPIGFVGYGSVGAVRAVEQLRLVAAELQMAPLRSAVHVGAAEMMGLLREENTFEDFPHMIEAANQLLDDMCWWAMALRDARLADLRTQAA